MAMVYTLVSHGKELIGDRFPPSVAEPEEEVSTVPTDCAPARLVKDGTVCTPETFLMWKVRKPTHLLWHESELQCGECDDFVLLPGRQRAIAKCSGSSTRRCCSSRSRKALT